MSWQVARVVARTDWADGLWTARLDVVLDRFAPGQFVRLGLEIDGEIVKRSYSVASAPGAPADFYLVRVEGGALTPRLDVMPVGGELLVDPTPLGFFTLEHVPPARDLWLLATGTGLAPYLSMLRSGVLWPRFERVVLVHGARQSAHLGHKEELEVLAAARPALRFVPMLSREEHPRILGGRIPAAIASGQLEHAAGVPFDPATAHVMICGNPEMIADTIATLEVRGLRRHRVKKPGHITIEKYW
jgi:ferredoxin/flavodoxin---NADP+ reductase